jgi:protein phosphatase
VVSSFGLSFVGCVRGDNEDRILNDDALGLFAVADGMGGHQHGEVAADLAISAVRYYAEASRDPSEVTWPFGYTFNLSPDANRLSTALRLANRHVWHYAEQGPEFAGMGTTVAALLLGAHTAVVANVGDSRVYLFREGILTQVTTDDTWVASVFGSGSSLPEDARHHPMRNVLLQAAGTQEDVQVHIHEQRLRDQDLFLICSDGLHGLLDDQTIGAILASPVELRALAETLLRAAEELRAPDNVSVVLVRFKSD